MSLLQLGRNICCVASLMIGALDAQVPRDVLKRLSVSSGVFRGQPVTFRVLNGQGLVEGDILLGPVEDLVDQKGGGREAVVIVGDRFRWPDGVVVYEVDPALPNKQRVTDAIAEWESKTQIRFKVREGETDYARITGAGSGCNSNVGRIGGRQTVNIEASCSTGNTIHELGHTLGLFHTQSRIDRGRNINVRYENIDKSYWSQYDQQLLSGQDIGPYDYASIMHYDVQGFARNPRNVQETVPPGIPIGQRTVLSSADVLAIRQLYGEKPTDVTIATNPPGLTVMVDGERVTTPKAFPWKAGEKHTVTAFEGFLSSTSPNTRHRFGKWSDDGDLEHTLTVGASDYLFIVNYVQQFRLRTDVSPAGAGTVQVTPDSPDGFYPTGTLLFLTATPAADLNFFGWTPGVGGGTYLAANQQGTATNPVELSIRTDLPYYIAAFASGPFTTITSEPAGVPVTVDGATGYTPRNFSWVAGSSHALTIPDKQAINGGTTQVVFKEWSNGSDRTQTYKAVADGEVISARVTRQQEVMVDFLSTLAVGTPSASVSQIKLSPPGDGILYDEGTEIEASLDPASPPFANFYGDLSTRQLPQKLVVRDQSVVGVSFATPPFFNARGMVNHAGQQPVPVSPGAWITIYSPNVGPDTDVELKPDAAGKYPVISNNIRVTFNGTAAGLVRLSKNSLTFVAPWDLGTQPVVTILAAGLAGSFTRTLTGAPAGPGVYTVDSRGVGQAAASNDDGSSNAPENPAFRGGELVLRVTGIGRFLGQAANAEPPAGSLTPVENVFVELGATRVEVTDIATSDLPGQFFVRVRINDAVNTGDAIPVGVWSRGARSQFGATVAIR